MQKIDLNCDVGEGTGNDAALMPFISSCSIACGGHFGNAKTIAATLALAGEAPVSNHACNLSKAGSPKPTGTF